MARSTVHRLLEGVANLALLPCPTHEGSVQTPPMTGRVVGHTEQSVRPDRTRDPFQRQARQSFDGHRVTHKPLRCVADHHLARRGSRLQASREVEDGAAAQRLPRAGYRLARCHSNPHSHAARIRERLLEIIGRSHRSQRIVVMHAWNAEDSQDGVPDELVDSAAVALNQPPSDVEVPPHHRPQRLSIEPVTQSR